MVSLARSRPARLVQVFVFLICLGVLFIATQLVFTWPGKSQKLVLVLPAEKNDGALWKVTGIYFTIISAYF